MPSRISRTQDIVLKTKKGDAIHQKSDIFERIMWFSYVNDPSNLLAIPLDNVLQILEQNKKGQSPRAT